MNEGGRNDDIDILLCTDYLPPSDGGVEHVVEELAYRLTDRGFRVGVYTLVSPGARIQLSDHPDISVFASKRLELTNYIGLQSAVSLSAPFDFRHVLRRFDPDLVHVHNRFFYTSYLGMLYKYVRDYPLVTTMHLGGLEHIDGMGGVAARIFQSVFAKRLVRASDSVICVSDAVAAVAQSLGAPRTEVVRNAVDLSRFEVDKPVFDKTLLYVGRLVRNNGPHDLIAAVPDILAAHPDASVNIVGSGKLKSELDRLSESLAVSDAVTIYGFVDDIVPMYEKADVFCRPSYSEGLPLTLLESMATYSVPVVTPVAGAEEVVSDGETGYFVSVNCPESIATTVNRLFRRPAEVEHVAEQAHASVKAEYSWEHRTEKVIEVYKHVLGHG